MNRFFVTERVISVINEDIKAALLASRRRGLLKSATALADICPWLMTYSSRERRQRALGVDDVREVDEDRSRICRWLRRRRLRAASTPRLSDSLRSYSFTLEDSELRTSPTAESTVCSYDASSCSAIAPCALMLLRIAPAWKIGQLICGMKL